MLAVCAISRRAGLEDRRCERRMLLALAGDQRLDRRAAALASDVDVVGTGLFEREPDELAATLDGRPIVELVAHRCLRVCFDRPIRTMRIVARLHGQPR